MNMTIVNNLLKELKYNSYKFQNDALLFANKRNKGTFSIPTGAGKSRIIYTRILEGFVDRTCSSFIDVITSHRLMLNSQHLTSLLNNFKPLIGKIGYVFVGSDGFKLKVKDKTKREFNKLLRKQGLNYKDIISSTISDKEIVEIVKEHICNNRKVVIVTTYHSLDKLKNLNINTIYCDEAHMLATQKTFSEFQKNFNKIKFEKSYFFTATTKDSSDDDTNAFLMNNKEIFGDRFELKFKVVVGSGLIVRPTIHLATPSNYDTTKKFGSVKNYYRFIKEVFIAHKKWIKKNSVNPSYISPKLLVKAASVDSMWLIFEKLKNDKELSDIRIFAGASRNDDGELHRTDKKDIESRYDYLKDIQDIKDIEEAIVLHYDIFSEGIDVPGLTGVMFLSDNLPTLPKILQNIGRATRLSDIDRKLLRNNEISTLDYSKWVKPSCAVILPVISVEGKYTVDRISEIIKNLRDRYGFDASYIVSEGDDLAKGKNDDEDGENLNKLDRKDGKDIITLINQEIERLDNNDNMFIFIQKANCCDSDDDGGDMDSLLEKQLY